MLAQSRRLPHFPLRSRSPSRSRSGRYRLLLFSSALISQLSLFVVVVVSYGRRSFADPSLSSAILADPLLICLIIVVDDPIFSVVVVDLLVVVVDFAAVVVVGVDFADFADFFADFLLLVK